MKYEAVVAYDSQRGISRDGCIPWFSFDEIRKPDMKWFRELTERSLCIAGRKTYDQILAATNGVGLDGRVNIVLTSNDEYEINRLNDHAWTVRNLEMLNAVTEILNHFKRTMYVIGGASVYEQLLPQTHTVWATEIKGDFACDQFFPELTDEWNWGIVNEDDNRRVVKYWRDN